MSTNLTTVTTGQIRLSYVHLITPYAHEQGDTPKFSTTILLPKSDFATKQRIDAAINAAIQIGVSSKWGGTRPAQVTLPLWDGDGLRQNGERFGPEAAGCWVFTASSNHQQSIVDAAMNPVLNPAEVYSGMYGRVSINFFAYATKGKKGVGCGLGPVQKLADGESLGGGQVSAAAAFGEAPPVHIPPSQLPQQQYPPQGQQYGQPAPQQYAAPVQPNYAAPVQPVYGQPAYPPQQYATPQQPYAAPQQPNYGQPNYPQHQGQPQQLQQVQIDPITGLPRPVGGVMGI